MVGSTAVPSYGDQLLMKVLGTVSAVDPALAGSFAVGDAFEYGCRFDSGNVYFTQSIRRSFLADHQYMKAGSTYQGAAPTGDQVQADFWFGAPSSARPTGQGLGIESHQIIAPSVGGLVLSDTFLDIGFDHPFTSSSIDLPQLLSLNTQPILGDDSSLSFGIGTYKYVGLHITSVSVTPIPEPGAAAIVAVACGLWAGRHRRRVV